jgi:EAL domain-containing protein (putative c-di-GMP-specific phosphodiesterase class I)
VGYEALTRFTSGQAPDHCFADAWSVGLGPELELATLAAATDAAPRLPAGRWLDLNVSPRLLLEPDRVRELIRACERSLILEVTEHEPVADYAALREAIASLGPDIRVAVDDAGAGAANFVHIIELRADLVKLDISLVRGVNDDLGRQAMVVGMRHFSQTAGCRLVAEGIETKAEARTLAGLGVEFGQGYLFGRPEPAEAFVALALGTATIRSSRCGDRQSRPHVRVGSAVGSPRKMMRRRGSDRLQGVSPTSRPDLTDRVETLP